MEPIQLLGRGASATWDGQTLTIRRGRGERTAPRPSITAVEFTAAPGLGDGFIRFAVAGTAANRARAGSRLSAVRDDEWAVVFARWAQRSAMALRDAVQSAIAAQTSHSSLLDQPGLADRLQKLADLHAAGQLTDVEYQTAKSQILSNP